MYLLHASFFLTVCHSPKSLDAVFSHWPKEDKAVFNVILKYKHVTDFQMHFSDWCCHYDGRALSYNPGLQYPHLHGPVHTPDNIRWDTPPV